MLFDKRKITVIPGDGIGPEVVSAALKVIEATGIDIEPEVCLASLARVGRNLLGDRDYAAAMSRLREGDLLLFVGGRGLYSFRGTSWRRDGWFRRSARNVTLLGLYFCGVSPRVLAKWY